MKRFYPLLFLLLAPLSMMAQTFEADMNSITRDVFSGDTAFQQITLTNLSNEEITLEISTASPTDVFFERPNGVDWKLPENQDSITSNVKITRANTRGIFNIALEDEFSEFSPADTEWAFGTTAEVDPGDYQSWVYAVDAEPPGMVGKVMSLHLISEDKYYDVEWHSWTREGGGGFSYTRSRLDYWLEFEKETITVPATSSVVMDVLIDLANIGKGNLRDTVLISISDSEEIIEIPVDLNVSESAGIKVEEADIDFGESIVNGVYKKSFTIQNVGDKDLLINDISIENDAYSVGSTSFGLDPLEEEMIEITFSPTAIQDYSTSVKIYTNDQSDPEYIIPISAQGVAAPVIEVAEDSLNVQMKGQEMKTASFTIKNTGESTLKYELAAGFSNATNKGSAAGSNARGAGISITFRVNMSEQVAKGVFDPETEFVDIAGTFNEWGEAEINQLSDDNEDLVYQATIDGFLPNEKVEFKFRLNGEWDGREEFPGIGNNRFFTVTESQERYYWYGDQVPLRIGNEKLLVEDVDEQYDFIDVKSIYTSVNESDITFTIEGYRPFEPSEVTDVLIIFDADQDPETGFDIRQADFPWEIGMEYYVGYDYQEEKYFFGELVNEQEVILADATFTFNPGDDKLSLTFTNEYLLDYEQVHVVVNAGMDNVPEGNKPPLKLDISPAWISFNEKAGSIAPGEEKLVEVEFNSKSLVSGEYSGIIKVNSNDPLKPVTELVALMEVAGEYVFEGPDLIDFGTSFIDKTDDFEFTVKNNGTAPIIISNLNSESNLITFSQQNYEVSPFSAQKIPISLMPDTEGNFSSSINITTDTEVITIPVVSEVLTAPVAEISTEKIETKLEPGKTFSESVSLANEGGSPLNYQIFEYPGFSVNLDRDFGYVDFMESYEINPSEAVTISMWVYLDKEIDCSNETNTAVLLGHGFSQGGFGYEIIVEEDHSVTWSIAVSGGLNRIMSDNTLPHDQWVFLTCTYDGQQSNIYFNGQLSNSQVVASATGSINSPYSFLFLSLPSEPCQNFEGRFPGFVSDLRIWEISRTEEEIGANMNKPLAGNEEGLLGYWLFDEGEGDISTDLSGNGHHAYLYGLSWKNSAPFDWIQLSPASGSIEGSNALDINVELSAMNLVDGIYETEIAINTSDPEKPQLLIPVILEVEEILSAGSDKVVTQLETTAYPNPFTEHISISYELAEKGKTGISIYNMSGKVVYSRELGWQAGKNTLTWDGKNTSGGAVMTGIYQAVITVHQDNGEIQRSTFKIIYQ